MKTTVAELALYFILLSIIGLCSAFLYEAYVKYDAAGHTGNNNPITLIKTSAILSIVSFGTLILMTTLYIIFSERHNRNSFGKMAAHMFSLLTMLLVLTVGILSVFISLRIRDNLNDGKVTGDKAKKAETYTIVSASLTLGFLTFYVIWVLYSMYNRNRLANIDMQRDEMRQSYVASKRMSSERMPSERMPSERMPSERMPSERMPSTRSSLRDQRNFMSPVEQRSQRSERLNRNYDMDEY